MLQASEFLFMTNIFVYKSCKWTFGLTLAYFILIFCPSYLLFIISSYIMSLKKERKQKITIENTVILLDV